MNNISITEQLSTNECGICVAKTLIKYYYKKNISKEELITKVKMTSNGINIYELENLLQQYGIGSETYEVTFEELQEKKFKDFFVTIISSEEGLHYVIAKCNKNDVEIYDSNKGKYCLKYEEFRLLFQNIIIFTFKNNKTIDFNFQLKKIINYTDWKYFFITNTISVLVVILSIIGGLFINKILDDVINNKSISNLISINIIFLLIYVSSNLLNLFISVFGYKNRIELFNIINFQVMKSIDEQNINFIKSCNINDILNTNDHINIISEFLTTSINKIFCDILTIIMSIVLLTIINYWTLLILVCVTIFIFIFNYFIYLINKKSTKFNYHHNNEYTKNFLSFIDNIKQQYEVKYTNTIRNKIFYTCHQLNNKNFKYDYKQMLIKFFFSSTQITFFILLITINVLAIINNDMNIGKMFFSISLFQMYLSSISNLFLFYLNYPKIKYSKDFLSKLINSMPVEKIGINIQHINKVKINQYKLLNDTLVVGKNGVGKTTMLKSIFNNEFNNQIQINEIDLKNVSSDWIKNNIIYLSNQFVCDSENILKLFNSEYQQLVINIINLTQIKSINEIDKLSTGQKQILAFLSLLSFKNKLIIIDELLSNVQKDIKKIIMQQVKPIIVKNNFLITVDHDEKIKNCFKQIVEVKDV